MSDTSYGGESEPGSSERSTFAADDAGSAGATPRARPGLISSSSAPSGGRASEVWAESAAAIADAEPEVDESAISSPSIELSDVEARVLGSMIEKSYLTPDVYPMTTNALVGACNQKTNRDPVVDFSAVQVDSTLIELRQRNLVRRVHSAGSRSTKHRQTLDETLSLDERQLALVSVLLLRGPQTIGELRLRTERHDVGFDDLDAVERCLEGLASRKNPLVQQLPRQPGHKESRWQHLLGDPTAVDPHAADTAEVDTEANTPGDVSAATSSYGSTPASPRPVAAAPNDALVARVQELEGVVATLKRQLATLAAKLGEPLE